MRLRGHLSFQPPQQVKQSAHQTAEWALEVSQALGLITLRKRPVEGIAHAGDPSGCEPPSQCPGERISVEGLEHMSRTRGFPIQKEGKKSVDTVYHSRWWGELRTGGRRH